ncbi:hypothetical protein EYF80_055022 [Liparis tanakae]|uniref:Uncharacterized protein n=1 Tax=Liparis tanakae TaxID=230148 RepID=A0A4Z2F102_9TELE|nr:hypothetical protein EYF80_055022 [Liparis tanakae]
MRKLSFKWFGSLTNLSFRRSTEKPEPKSSQAKCGAGCAAGDGTDRGAAATPSLLDPVAETTVDDMGAMRPRTASYEAPAAVRTVKTRAASAGVKASDLLGTKTVRPKGPQPPPPKGLEMDPELELTLGSAKTPSLIPRPSLNRHVGLGPCCHLVVQGLNSSQRLWSRA